MTFTFDKQYEDIHMVIEAALVERIGDVGRKFHTGRSRNDQVALDMRLWMRDAITSLQTAILRTMQQALVDQAKAQGNILMPGYTHMQRAQPVLVGPLSSGLRRDVPAGSSASGRSFQTGQCLSPGQRCSGRKLSAAGPPGRGQDPEI